MTEFDSTNQAPDPTQPAGQVSPSAQGVLSALAPVAQTTDPANGAPTGVGGILQGTGLEQIAAGFLKHWTDVQKNSPIGVQTAAQENEKKAKAAAPVVDRPVPAPSSAPGSTFDSSGAASEPQTGGFASKLGHALSNLNPRFVQRQKDEALLATSQAQNIAMHRNFYNQDAKDRQEFHEGNQKFLSQYDESNDQEKGVSPEEIAKRMKADPSFASKYLVRATGDTPVVDGNGNEVMEKDSKRPQMKPSYTVMTIASKDGSNVSATVDAERSAEMGKYLGVKMPAGTKLTMAQDNKLDQELQVSRGTATILGNTNGKPLSPETIEDARTLLADPTVAHAVALVPGNAYAGIVQSKNIAEQHRAVFNQQKQQALAQKDQAGVDKANAGIASVNEEESKLDSITSKVISKDVQAAYEKKSDGTVEQLTDLRKKADGAKGEEAAAISAQVKDMLENKNEYTDQQKQILTNIQRQMDASVKASHDYSLKQEKDKAEATNALAEGDTDVLVESALKYNLNPDKLYSMRKNTNAEFKAKMLRQDPNWSASTYEQRYNMNKDLAKDTPTSMGGQVDSLNRFAMHTGAANRGIQGLRNTNSPILNMPLNKITSAMKGFEEAQAFKIDAEAAKDEFLGFIKNGRVPPTEQEERLAQSISYDHTPAELQSTFRAMAELVGARAKSMNGRYATLFGSTPEKPQNIPGLIQPDTASILKQFGVDVPAITNTFGETSFSRPINPTAPAGAATAGPAGGTHPMVMPDKTSIWLVNNQWVTANGQPYKAK